MLFLCVMDKSRLAASTWLCICSNKRGFPYTITHFLCQVMRSRAAYQIIVSHSSRKCYIIAETKEPVQNINCVTRPVHPALLLRLSLTSCRKKPAYLSFSLPNRPWFYSSCRSRWQTLGFWKWLKMTMKLAYWDIRGVSEVQPSSSQFVFSGITEICIFVT